MACLIQGFPQIYLMIWELRAMKWFFVCSHLCLTVRNYWIIPMVCTYNWALYTSDYSINSTGQILCKLWCIIQSPWSPSVSVSVWHLILLPKSAIIENQRTVWSFGKYIYFFRVRWEDCHPLNMRLKPADGYLLAWRPEVGEKTAFLALSKSNSLPTVTSESH